MKKVIFILLVAATFILKSADLHAAPKGLYVHLSGITPTTEISELHIYVSGTYVFQGLSMYANNYDIMQQSSNSQGYIGSGPYSWYFALFTNVQVRVIAYDNNRHKYVGTATASNSFPDATSLTVNMYLINNPEDGSLGSL